jgi:hypothetical protein
MEWVVNATPPGFFTLGTEIRYSFCKRLDWPHVRYGQVRKISPLPGFDARNIQPVSSHYTFYAIQTPEAQKKTLCLN